MKKKLFLVMMLFFAVTIVIAAIQLKYEKIVQKDLDPYEGQPCYFDSQFLTCSWTNPSTGVLCGYVEWHPYGYYHCHEL